MIPAYRQNTLTANSTSLTVSYLHSFKVEVGKEGKFLAFRSLNTLYVKRVTWKRNMRQENILNCFIYYS